MIEIYRNLSKVEAICLFLLRAHVIGLNAWLAEIGVPGTTPHANVGGGHKQPLHDHITLIRATGTENLDMLSHRKTGAAVARWFIGQGIFSQFRPAYELQNENRIKYRLLPGLENLLENGQGTTIAHEITTVEPIRGRQPDW